MTYLALARKYRPRSFDQVIGQQHVVQTFTNALNQQKLHHAYLFTGTRGVGKTTIARILAKCLNCETGITATPCGTCSSCQEIDQGRFVDLYEVDAASRTKVEDTRELLDNVQYSPSKGRFKIYLIDEVHMLSGHSFNALLKTLEEPPEHVKFLLATTDPQKLPATVLSRCLQFHLQNMTSTEISGHLATILDQEKITYEADALPLLAHAANGSMRDALSLLDQAIAYSNNAVVTDVVATMLGTVDQQVVSDCLDALATQDITAITRLTEKIALQGWDFRDTLTALQSRLHQIAIAQLSQTSDDQYTQQFSQEDIQLYYQIAVQGLRDLPYTPSPRLGFEMTLIRMLAFTPVAISAAQPMQPTASKRPQTAQAKAVQPAHTTQATKPATPPLPQAAEVSNADDAWSTMVPKLGLAGASLAAAKHCSLLKQTENTLELNIAAKHMPLLNDRVQVKIETAVSTHLGKPTKIHYRTDTPNVQRATPQQRQDAEDHAKLNRAKATLAQDAGVQEILKTFNATIVEETIESNE